MRKTILLYVILLLVPCSLFLGPRAQAQNIQGQIFDAITGDSIPFAALRYRGHKISMASNHAGRFSIERHNGWKLTFSAIGYENESVDIDEDTPVYLNVSLMPKSNLLSEVTVKGKRQRYRRKENPAVELMRRVISAKKRTDLANNPYYEYYNYQKITLAMNDIKPDDIESNFGKKNQWLVDQVEPCVYNNKLILPLSLDETVTRHIYRRSPHSQKDIIIGQKSQGINQVIQTGELVNIVMRDAFTDVDIYDDQIRLLRHYFISPIGREAISFYRYYIVDTVKVDRDSCYHLEFLPNNQQDLGFRGELYILKDTTYHVKRCNMTLPKSSDVNFVENLWVQQEYTLLDNGQWALTTDDMIAELALTDFLQKAIAIRTTRKSDYAFEPIDQQLFKGKVPLIVDPDAAMRKETFWQHFRKVDLTRSEERMGRFIKSMKERPWYRAAVTLFKIGVENFVETGSEETPSKVDIGPINTIITRNFIDGWRFRGSLQTTANLNPYLFFKGYYARGMSSKKNYYKTTFVASLNKKNYTYDEFPRRTITIESTNDVMSPSDKFLSTDKDNVFTSFHWTTVDKMMFYNRQTVQFDYETDYNFAITASIKAEKNEAAGNLEALGYNTPISFIPDPSSDDPAALMRDPSSLITQLRTTELMLRLRYAPGEKYMNTKQHRVLVNKDAPVFTVSHTFGIDKLFGGQYRYNFSEATAYYRLWLSSWGKMEFNLRAAAQWNQVPLLLLVMPETNLSYISQPHTFSMMNNMELVSDRYLSFMIDWDLKGKLLNRVPLLRKLKLRDYLGFRTVWGTLTDKNKDQLPDYSYALDPHRPYCEWSVGIHNIFKILRVEYVHRMNYTSLPNSRKHGVRFLFNFTF